MAYSMLESGNWILPVNYGTDIAYKPPFFYWAIAAVSSLLGGVTEYSSRLPSALAFLAMQLVFFSFIAKRKDVKTAFLASILLLSSFEVHRAALACRVDMVQVSFIVISLCLLFRWDEKGCRRIPWLAVLLMGCATLTKGPVGSIFPCVCIGIYQLLRGRAFWKTFFSLLVIGLLSLVPYAAWIGAAYAQGGQSFLDLVLEENTGRFMGKMSYDSHENPVWYNFLTIIWGWVPWTLVLLLSLFGLKWKSISWLPEGASFGERIRKAWDKFRSQSPLQLFTWVVILFIFIFYCIPKSKRSVYLLPIYPFMAVLMAEYLLALVQRGAKVFKVSAIIFASLCLILTAVFLAVRFGLVPDSVFGSGRHAAENVAYMHALEEAVLSIPKWCLVALPLIAAVCTWMSVGKRSGAYSLLYSIAGCILCLFASLDAVYQPVVLAVNKVDQGQSPDIYEFYNLGLGDPIAVSAVHGHGTGDLLDAVFEYLPDEAEEEEDPDVIRVAVIGRPNAGKSSLINRIAGEERTIVSNIAGTTRDSVDTPVHNQYGDFVFIDTAGLRRKSKVDDAIEKYSVLRAEMAVERADVCVILIDGVEGFTEQDSKVAGIAHQQGKACIIAVNKWDAVEKDDKTMDKMRKKLENDFSFMSYAPFLFISAKTGQRVDRLFEQIAYVYAQSTMRISTGKLNEILGAATARVQPPTDKGKRLKIYYMTQASVCPPTFVFFVNNAQLFHFSYQRYLENQIREVFGLEGTPVRFIIRERGEGKK